MYPYWRLGKLHDVSVALSRRRVVVRPVSPGSAGAFVLDVRQLHLGVAVAGAFARG
jgi:hypothetical protein